MEEMPLCLICVRNPGVENKMCVHACVCVCVCVCVCGGEWTVHCSLHLCGSPLLFQVATCSFLVQKEHGGPKQKGGTQTLGGSK